MKVIDLHCDTLWKIEKEFLDGKQADLLKNDFAIDFERMAIGNVGLQCFALFTIPQNQKPFETANRMIDFLERDVKKVDNIRIVKSYSDIEKNFAEGVMSAMITMEDGFMLEGSFDKLDTLYDRGVRMICLNHNVKNGIGNPNYGKYIDGRPDWITRNTTTGLTDFGFELVEKMNQKGIVIDLSHMSDAGFYDVVKASTKPIVASHSNACGINNGLRNLTDDMMKKLADNGGVMGICFASGFLDKDKEIGKNTIECAIRHIDYVKNLIGIDNLAFGSDFDGVPNDIEINSCDKFPKLIKALSLHGYKDSELEKICYKNALRVFKENLK